MLLHIGTCTIYAKVTLLLFIVAMVTVFSDEIGGVAALTYLCMWAMADAMTS